MAGERALLFATDPPYAVGYTGGSHPQSWGNKSASNRDKDWSGTYVEAQIADVKNSEEAGLDLYCGFIDMAIQHAIAANAAWYCWYASRRHSMVERAWNKFNAIVHQQIIWVKTRPVYVLDVPVAARAVPIWLGSGSEAKNPEGAFRAERWRISDDGVGSAQFRSRDRCPSHL